MIKVDEEVVVVVAEAAAKAAVAEVITITFWKIQENTRLSRKNKKQYNAIIHVETTESCLNYITVK